MRGMRVVFCAIASDNQSLEPPSFTILFLTFTFASILPLFLLQRFRPDTLNGSLNLHLVRLSKEVAAIILCS
jgi:ABC-type transport system involved in cytochrome c biogenesis permease component